MACFDRRKSIRILTLISPSALHHPIPLFSNSDLCTHLHRLDGQFPQDFDAQAGKQERNPDLRARSRIERRERDVLGHCPGCRRGRRVELRDVRDEPHGHSRSRSRGGDCGGGGPGVDGTRRRILFRHLADDDAHRSTLRTTSNERSRGANSRKSNSCDGSSG